LPGRRFVRAAISLITIIAGATVVPSPASAATLADTVNVLATQDVNIRGLVSEKCVDDPDNSYVNNTVMIIYTRYDPKVDNQKWTFTPTDGGYYNIWNELNGKCLIVLNNSPNNNAAVIQFDCNTGDNEEWRTHLVGNVDDDYYEIINRHSQKCLTVKNASTANKATLLQFGCNGGGNQYWTWE
jgi:hypothetical protein